MSHCSFLNTYLLQHMVTRFGHLLKLPAYFTEPERLRRYADAVWSRGSRFGNCVGFIDGTLRQIARPSKNQRGVYSGHKKVHGIKFQSVIFADGMIVEQYGPYEGRRSDPWMMHESEIVARLERVHRNYWFGHAQTPLTPPV